jgi:hypothetical protein
MNRVEPQHLSILRIAGLDGIGFAAGACGASVPTSAVPAIRPLLPRASPQPCLEDWSSYEALSQRSALHHALGMWAP